MKTTFIPVKNSELNSFENNFKVKLSLHANSLGIDPAEVTEVVQVLDENINAYTTMVSLRNQASSSYAEYKIKKSIALKELRRISKKIKSSKGYDISIGEDLDIISPRHIELVSSEKKPELKVKVDGHKVIIRYNKGVSDMINIYSRRGNEAEFTFLDVYKDLFYEDDRPKIESGKPEQREYYAFFKEKKSEIGKRSDIVKIVVP
ncbi:MAG TPA: hypothetical protein PKA90_13735 [Ignavibacteria bacterium]|nr:hypothetical protein [Ignavibacteria bacterium]HMR41480.1 hypothetical protein [Ignavibacteria bacterium]